jgi:hypothetical protein
VEYMQFIEALVNAQTEDERMELVKEHAQTFAPQEGDAGEMATALEEMTAQIATLKKEIKDRFFGKYEEPKTETEASDEETEASEESSDEGEPTLNDLGFGNKTY